MTKKNRLVAVVTAFILIFTMLASIDYIAHHTQHDCTGDNDCPICHQLTMANTVLAGNKLLPVIIVFAVLVCVTSKYRKVFTELFCSKKTLITLKIELLN